MPTARAAARPPIGASPVSRARDVVCRLALGTWPFALVTALGLWLLWPVPAGVMPLSADHTVHLTRAWLYGQQLASGHLTGWSPHWFFGFPLGELYPPLGDLAIALTHAASGGALAWPTSYALVFTLVFLLQGWALLRCGRALGWGPFPGLVAAVLALLDVGAYREGGWTYTVFYGVWPQALATSLAWLALAELALAARAREALSAETGPPREPAAPAPDAEPLSLRPGPSAPPDPVLPAMVPATVSSGHVAAAMADPAGSLAQDAPDRSATPGPSGPASAAMPSGPAPSDPAPATMPSGPALSAPAAPVRPPGPGTPPPPPADAKKPEHPSPKRPEHPTSASAAPAAHRRHLVAAALAAAGALLAHPMSLPMFAVAAPLWLATVGLRGASPAAPPGVRERLAAAALDLALVLALALGLAAWWLWPMSAHRGYMAAYGWLYAPLDAMLRMLAQGQWTQLMAPPAGFAALAGLALAAVSRGGVLRFFALMAVVHWLLASTDVFWGLRLDRLGAGFTHIQYQRFLTAAKPGLYLLAGAVVGALWQLARRTWSTTHVRKVLSLGSGALALLLAGWLARDAWTLARRHEVGAVQVERVPGKPEFAAAYQQFLAWTAEAWQRRDADWRLAVRADRNAHWFMDTPVHTGAPLYKVGFVPGDNFVHKPESGDPRVLDRAGARYLLSLGPGGPGTTQVASFGPLRVHERAGAEGLAHLDGDGAAAIEASDLAAGRVRVRVTGASPGARLVFHVAGYPRWDLSFTPDGGGAPEPVDWFEAPIVGDGPTATPAQRLAGLLPGGKALGDDGSEPTLIAAPARDGVYELRYVRWRWFDVAAALASLAAAALAVSLVLSPRPLARLRPLARRLAHPAALAALAGLALALAGLRWQRAAARERPLASAWLAEGRAAATHVRSGPLKTDMQIVPAVLADPRRPSSVTFPRVTLGPTLAGWVALDDDDAKLRRRGGYRLEIRARPPGAADWTTILDMPVPHRPDRQHLAAKAPVPTDIQGEADLAVVLTPTGDAPPKLGFNLELGPR